MKKLGGVFVAGCLAAALVQGPATAETRKLPSRKQIAKQCRAFFAETHCQNFAAEWHAAMTSGSEVAAERFVDAVIADALGGTDKSVPGSQECRIVFSEGVCVYYDWTVGIVLWPIMDPEGFVNTWRAWSLQYVDQAYGILDGAYRDAKAAIRCAIDPACTPLPI